MLPWIRNLVIIFALLSIVYVLLSVTSNIRKRQKLKSQYHGEGEIETQTEFVERGLREYNRSSRPKMLLGIYIIPFAAIILLVYLAQT